MQDINETYTITADNVPGEVTITSDTDDYVPVYQLSIPEIEKGTEAVLSRMQKQIVNTVELSAKEFVDAKELEQVKEKFTERAHDLVDDYMGDIPEEEQDVLVGKLVHDMLGLGNLEMLLSDENLEEIVVNSSEEPVWVYHKIYGWLKTDLYIGTEDDIYNYASIIARRSGKELSTLHPLLDARLRTGDRTNATLYPISTEGNTITIRKFARDPWTIVDFINLGTIEVHTAALLWLCIQYEMNILVTGGTGSGKTSLLNVLMPFIPPNQRIVSIEDTREITLPDFLHWVPLTTREAGQNEEGNVAMQDLLVNSLRMRPDRIVVGEIRRQRQAEVLFEAMHTGHSVYSTLHADTAEQTVRRLINPPINVPAILLESVDLNVVMYRDRRKNIRRVMEIGEIIPEYGGGEASARANVLYRWNARNDSMRKENDSMKLFEKFQLYLGMSEEEIDSELEEKQAILQWLVDKDVEGVDRIGKIIAEYYQDRETVLNHVENGDDPETLL